jgi:Tetratricopeptide repeat
VLDATAHARHLQAATRATVNLLNGTVSRLLDTGQIGTARPLIDRALDIAQEALGPDHPDTLTTRSNLVYMLGTAGQPDEAAAEYRELLDDDLRVLGPDHPDTLASIAYWQAKRDSDS